MVTEMLGLVALSPASDTAGSWGNVGKSVTVITSPHPEDDSRTSTLPGNCASIGILAKRVLGEFALMNLNLRNGRHLRESEQWTNTGP